MTCSRPWWTGGTRKEAEKSGAEGKLGDTEVTALQVDVGKRVTSPVTLTLSVYMNHAVFRGQTVIFKLVVIFPV